MRPARSIPAVAIILGCGPSVDVTDGASADTEAQATTTSTSVDDATSSAGAMTSSLDSTSDSGSEGSGTTAAPIPPEACVDNEFDYLALSIQQEGSFDIGATCMVEDAFPSIDVEFLELTCPTGDVTVLANGLGFEDYFVPGDMVELIAAREPGAWEHVALLDARGNFIAGTYSLSPEAPDFTDIFLSVDFEAFETDCDPEIASEGCEFRRAGVELTLEGQTQRVVAGTSGDFGTVQAYTTAAWYDDVDACLDAAGMIVGSFTLVVPLTM